MLCFLSLIEMNRYYWCSKLIWKFIKNLEYLYCCKESNFILWCNLVRCCYWILKRVSIWIDCDEVESKGFLGEILILFIVVVV